jgi:CDP-diacylglycerol--serine O-phosphatidyltransferase
MIGGSGARRIRTLPFNRLLPNVLTVLALCAGLTSIRFSLQEKWELAVVAVLLAALLDALDGRIARRFGGVTKFGAELDSLADFLSFGVAPALSLYLWSLQRMGGFGWVVALVLAVCAALRLARFNARLGETDLPAWAPNFFTGVPAPAAAASALLPVMLSFELGDTPFRHPTVTAVVAVAVAFLMISRLPTYSFKQLRIPHRYVVPMLLLVGLVAALLVTVTWITMSLLVMAYLTTIPLAYRDYQRREAAEGATTPEAEAEAERVFEEPIEATELPDDDIGSGGAPPAQTGGSSPPIGSPPTIV